MSLHSMAAERKAATVWQQDFAKMMRGDLKEEDFYPALEKIVKARQEGKFPLGDEKLRCYKGEQILFKDALERYHEMKEVKDLTERSRLLSCEFFTTIIDSQDCTLSTASRNNAQKKYLPKAFEAIQSQKLLQYERIKEWLEKFAIVSYSRVIDMLDRLYEGFDLEIKRDVEAKSEEMARQLFSAFQKSEYNCSHLKSFIAMISFEQLGERFFNEDIECKNDTLKNFYEGYKQLQKNYFSDREILFWETRIVSLKTFLERVT